MGEVIDLAEARRRRDEKKLKRQIKKNTEDRGSGRRSSKISDAMAKWGNLNGSKSLERMKKLFTRKNDDDTKPDTD